MTISRRTSIVCRSPGCSRRSIRLSPSTDADTQHGRLTESTTVSRSAAAGTTAGGGSAAGGSAGAAARPDAASGCVRGPSAGAAGAAGFKGGAPDGSGTTAGAASGAGVVTFAGAGGCGSTPRPAVAKCSTIPAIGRLNPINHRKAVAIRRSFSTDT
jgi:hypothetical protein